jgi:2,3-bisphosphoglycerate-dependent phosphoglycerate mutase
MTARVLAWIRHGEYAQPPGVPSAHLPHGLTPRGREQARAAAHAVAEYAAQHALEIHCVLDCSRLRRAWETAHLLARELERLGAPPLTVQEFDDLGERSLGAAANLTIEQIEAVLAADPRFEVPPSGWKRDPTYVLPLPGAESLEHAGRRVARHVTARMRALVGESSLKLFVGHGGAFRHAARELGLLSHGDVERLSMQHAAPIYFEHSSVEHGADGLAGDRLTHRAGQWRERTAASPLD